MSAEDCTVVVVTWRGAAHLTACLDAVAAQDRPHRTIVVDNASDDGSRGMAAVHPSAPQIVEMPDNVGYAGALAAALPLVDTPYMAWLNDDAVPGPDWLSLLCVALEHSPTVGAASAQLVSADGRTQSVGVGLTEHGYGFDVTAGGEVVGFCGGAAVLRTEALRRIGGIPAEFFCYYEDTDVSLRLRLAGFSLVSVPAARVVHAHGASAGLGSAAFHHWNERNRLLMLVRCAPVGVAVRELVRFKLLTLRLALRRQRPAAPNFSPALRLRVLFDVARLLPWAVRERRRISAASVRSRSSVWHESAGALGSGHG